MDNVLKIVLAGLDNAGKTSILTALNKKYDFRKDIISLTPTIRVEYHVIEFLKKRVIFWDMGGQETYRKMYEENQDMYFTDTDLLIYVIDVQDKDRFLMSINYLSLILRQFKNHKINVRIIITFHKFDPEIYNDDDFLSNVKKLKEIITNKNPYFNILYQQTSIYDIISIIKLVSYSLSVFDESFYILSDLIEEYLKEFGSKSLILFDKNAIIISEFYNDIIEPETYNKFIESIKDHIFLLKRMQEESYELESNLSLIGHGLLSYLHKIEIGDKSFFISVVIREHFKESFLEKFSDFLVDVKNLLEPLILS